MPSVTLRLKDIMNRNYTITVPRDINIANLLYRIGTQLRRPIEGISHAGHRLQQDNNLSDYLFLNFNNPFYIHYAMHSGFQPSIVDLNNAQKTARDEVLEAHLQARMIPGSRGERMAYRSGVKKALLNAGRELPSNFQNRVLNYLGGKRKTRKSKKSRRKTRKSS